MSTRLQNIEQNQKLSITWVNCPSQPPPVSNKYVWVKRRVVITKAVTAGTSTFTYVNTGDVATALTGVSGDYTIYKAHAWFAPTGGTAGGIFAGATFRVQTNNMILAGSGAVPVAEVIDYGTGTSMPGVSFKTPLAHVKNFEHDTAGVVDLVGLASSLAGTLICHMTVMQCITA